MDEVRDERKRPDGWTQVQRGDLAAVCQRAGHRAAVVWVMLGTYASRPAGVAWPLQKRLAADLGVPDRWVRRRLVELRDADLLTCVWKTSAAGRRRIYIVRDPAP